MRVSPPGPATIPALISPAYGSPVAGSLFNSILPEGAHVMDGQTVFRIWAPKAADVSLLIKGEADTRPLTRDARDHYAGTFDDLGEGTDYMFRVEYPDGWHEDLPDPNSRFQSCPVGGIDGWSRVVDLKSFDWGGDHHRYIAFTDMRIYEMHVGLFTKAGTFAAMLEGENFEYLTRYLRDELNINTIEIMPVHENPGEFNWGYDVVLPFGTYRVYGTPRKLQELVKRLHEEGFSVVFDVVLNHLGKVRKVNDEWATFFGYFANRNADEHPEWGPSLRFFSRDGDSDDPTGEFAGALHNLAMAEQLIAMYINDFGADAIRFDMTPYIADHTGWDRRDENYAVLRLLREMTRKIDPRVHFIAEDYRPKDGALDFYERTGIDHSWNFALSDALMRMLFPGHGTTDRHFTMDEIFNAALFGTFRRFADGEKIPPPFVNYFISHDVVGNHENEPRPIAVDRERALIAYALSAVARGALMLFMGEEYGAGTIPAEGDFFREGEAAYQEMFHFFARYPHFDPDDTLISRGYASKEDQDANEPQRFQAMTLLKQHSPAWDQGVFTLWTDLMALREGSDAIRSEEVLHRSPLYVSNELGVLIFMRVFGDDVVIVGVNLSDVDYSSARGDRLPIIDVPCGNYAVAVNTQEPKYGGSFAVSAPRAHSGIDGEGWTLGVPLPPRSVVILRNQ